MMATKTDKETSLKELFYKKPSPSKNWEDKVRYVRNIPILHICERLGIKARQETKHDWYAPCPCHDDDGENFHISPSKGKSGLWYCFHCKRGGDGLSIYMEVKGYTFPEAVRVLTGGKTI